MVFRNILSIKSGYPQRLSLIVNFLKGFILLSFTLRVILLLWQYDEVSWNIISLLRTVLTGMFFDVGTSSFIVLPSLFYLFVVPNRYVGSITDKILIRVFFTLTIFVLVLTFFAEVTFWQEFRTRFNFIAVDYLIYTHEVVANIQQSYPLPLLIGGVVAITALVLFVLSRRNVFKKTFAGKLSFKQRSAMLASGVLVASFFGLFIRNNDAELSSNRYNNEIAKAGIYSFFAEFRNNRMKYDEFYTTINEDVAEAVVKKGLAESDCKFYGGAHSILRQMDPDGKEVKPNVVLILMESMSADFMKEFGNTQGITPVMDDLAQNSFFFSNLSATGTRTVRGMEAVTLCIPPTPGQSIVKRPDNHNMFTIGTVFRDKGYNNNFFYGGDGYFDNMNSYFGGNGFTIYDRGRGSVLSDDIKTERYLIADDEVTFENAWGICDEDIYGKMLSVADEEYAARRPFFNFVMTTSNHRPYTYPENKIDIPSGTGREGAVKYADYALGRMLKEASKKPWFKNTVFVIVADHCASSAGKDEIDIAHYHIPAIIYNLPKELNRKVEKQCSQIDIFPTLFSLLHWKYSSNFFGKDVLCSQFSDRAFVGTYRKLALLEKDNVVILSDQKKQACYNYKAKENSLVAKPLEKDMLKEAIAWYQTADYLFSKGLLKEK